MAIKPFINPGVAVAERPATISSAMNFISGGAPLGTSVVSAAANKIVGFQRGAAAVAPRAPDLGSIIKTLSTNILNNVENRVQSINQNVQQFIQKNFQSQLGEYREKMQSVDADQPSKILQNFLGLYEKAIGYMQFFANPRNVKQLGQNLRDLRNVFAETFEVAKNIRKTIVRIVGQLSSLPTASAGGGGINLDVDLPGAPLKRGGAPLRRRMGGARGLAAGVGLGMGVSAVTSALAQPGGAQEVSSGLMGSEGTIAQPLLEKFSTILDRFSVAISSLSKQQAAPAAAAPSAGAAAGPAASPGGAPAASPGGPATMPGTDQDLYTLATISGLESGTAQGQADVAQAVYNRMSKGGKSATEILTAQGQFEPAFTAPYKISGGAIDPAAKNIKTFEDAVNFRMKKTGESKSKAEAAIKSTIANLQNQQLQQNAATFVGARTSFRGSPQNVGKLSNTIWRGSRSDNQFLNEEVAKGTAAVPSFVAGTGKPGTVAQVAPGKEVTVTPAPTQQQVQQQTAQSVSRPAIIQSTPQTTIAPPITMGQQGARGMQKPPVTSAGKVSGESSVPFLPPGNPDNFLTLYSKMVYNIVDG